MIRRKLNVSGDFRETLVQMAEGNPGALSVLMKLMELPDMQGFLKVLSLDDMNLRGWQIWVAWKDHCKADMPTFLKALQERDPEMVATVNASQGGSPETPRAVTSGASYEHTR